MGGAGARAAREGVTTTEPPTSPFGSDATTPPPGKPLTTAERGYSVGVWVHFCGWRGLGAVIESTPQCFISTAVGLPPLSPGPLSTFLFGLAFSLLGLKTSALFSFPFHYLPVVTGSEASSHLQIAHPTRKLGQRSLSHQ